jgi:mannitol/fructose-specific phosphotransferase system IIA component (Ntr-type)
VESVERQVFDICALSITDNLPDFESSDAKQKKFTFRLLKQAIEQNPSALQTILSEVLELPKDKQDELAELLRQTSLSAIINAAKVVAGTPSPGWSC